MRFRSFCQTKRMFDRRGGSVINKGRNIVLIGMPACGKSVTGVVMAKALGMKFTDTDLLIQERAGKGLQRIIDEDGIEAFRNAERDTLCGIETENTVIATGGSAVYYEDAMRHLGKNSVIIYIRISMKDVKKRLRNIKTRGVAMKKGQTLDELYQERVPLYEKYADITVDSNRESMEKTVEKMLEAIRSL